MQPAWREGERETRRGDRAGLRWMVFEPAKRGVVPGGVLAAIVPLGEGRFSVAPGELRAHFSGWEILHDREGTPGGSSQHRAAAGIVARQPFKLN